MTHAVGHRPKMGEEAKAYEMRKAPRHLGPPDSSIKFWPEGTHRCVEKGINGSSQWWTRNAALPVEKIEDEVKHIFREHRREADHWANLAGDGDEGRHCEQRKQQ